MEIIVGFLLLMLSSQIQGYTIPHGRVRVTVNEGILEGSTYPYQESLLQVDTQVDVFLGVPYADPPLRFALPEPKTPWTDVYEATEFKPACQQGPSPLYPVQSEDCLYLNIYAPSPKPTNAAVMVWIHGGGLSEGSVMSAAFTGGPIVSVGDVILVTFNYRLSIFGAFTTNDEAAPGNMGMLDQVAALRWVYENIEAFGGDRNKITIFGESAGGSSVSFHLLSKLSQGYFTQAIMQSGSALAEWAFKDNVDEEMEKVESLARAMECDAENTAGLVQCLRSKDPEVLQSKASKIYIENYVTLDGTFLEDSPLNLYLHDDFKKLPLIAGFTKDEGTFYTLFEALPIPPVSGEAFEETIRDLMSYGGITDEAVQDVVLQEYMDWTIADNPEADYFQAAVDFLTDTQFACNVDSELRFHSNGNNSLYEYIFTHAPTQSILTLGEEPQPWLGAGHAEDIPFVFGWSFIEDMRVYAGYNITVAEMELSHKMIKFWTNFAKSGDPSKASVESSPGESEDNWPAFDLPGLRYKDISLTLGEGRALKARKCAFWREYFPGVLEYAAEKGKSATDDNAGDSDNGNEEQPDSRAVLESYRELLGEWQTAFNSFLEKRNQRCNQRSWFNK